LEATKINRYSIQLTRPYNVSALAKHENWLLRNIRIYVVMLYNKHGVLRATLEPCTKANTNKDSKRRVNRRGTVSVIIYPLAGERRNRELI